MLQLSEERRESEGGGGSGGGARQRVAISGDRGRRELRGF